jgi:hypothetical protein
MKTTTRTTDTNERDFGISARAAREAERYAAELRARTGGDYCVQTLRTGCRRVQLFIDPFEAFEAATVD